MNIPNVLPRVATRTARRPGLPRIRSSVFVHAVLITVGYVSMPLLIVTGAVTR